MAVKKRSRHFGVKLEVRAQLLEPERAEKLPRAMAYAYSSDGRLLASAELNETGSATLVLSAVRQAPYVRVLVGPAVDDEQPRASQLLRRGAEERRLRIEPGQLVPRLDLAILPDNWLCWPASICFVPGRLVKQVDINGIPTDLPVCGAEVEVYEVEPVPRVVARLTQDAVKRIRGFVLESLLVEGPLPPGRLAPPPPPLVEPGRSLCDRAFSTDLGDLMFAAQTGGDLQLRRALVRFADFTRLALCQLYPFGPTMDLVATAFTDGSGQFRARIFRGCKDPDTPDLYFKAKQSWAFGDVTIYEPTPVSGYTHWSYPCGTEVRLHTSSPFARTLNPRPPTEPPVRGLDWVPVLQDGDGPLSLGEMTRP